MNCLDCGPQPVTEFYIHKNKKTGRICMDSRCHVCRKIRLAARNYGIPNFQYRDLIESAGGVCAICGERKKLTLDHCHKTGKLRGALCARCNEAIAPLEKGPEFIARAMAYLEYWEKQDASFARVPPSRGGGFHPVYRMPENTTKTG